MTVTGNSLRKFQIKGFQSTLQTLINVLYMQNTYYHILSIRHDCKCFKTELQSHPEICVKVINVHSLVMY